MRWLPYLPAAKTLVGLQLFGALVNIVKCIGSGLQCPLQAFQFISFTDKLAVCTPCKRPSHGYIDWFSLKGCSPFLLTMCATASLLFHCPASSSPQQSALFWLLSSRTRVLAMDPVSLNFLLNFATPTRDVLMVPSSSRSLQL